MNLATLVSSLVLAASTATAGLLVAPASPLLPHAIAPPLPPASRQDGPTGPGVQVGPLCVGVCGNGTSDNRTTPPPGHNGTTPPPSNSTAPPPPANTTAPPRTCGVDIQDSQQVDGPASFAWSWQVGSDTRNLTVAVQASGAWNPLGGGVQARLVDGNGNVVASADDSGTALPFGLTAIDYAGSAHLAHGVWHLTVSADGVLGSIYVEVHSGC